MPSCGQCRATFDPPPRGRPRKFCLTCRPRKRALVEKVAEQVCVVCGKCSNARYCSESCKWIATPRVPCGDCGSPTGWKISQKVGVPRCLACRRRNPPVRPKPQPQRWLCGRCGVECERPAMKGQRPRYCSECRIRDWITPTRRLAVYERDAWTCWLCEEPVDRDLIGSRSIWRPSLDHVTPRSAGGSNSESNLRLAHMWCNCVRSDGKYAPEVFRVSA